MARRVLIFVYPTHATCASDDEPCDGAMHSGACVQNLHGGQIHVVDDEKTIARALRDKCVRIANQSHPINVLYPEKKLADGTVVVCASAALPVKSALGALLPAVLSKVDVDAFTVVDDEKGLASVDEIMEELKEQAARASSSAWLAECSGNDTTSDVDGDSSSDNEFVPPAAKKSKRSKSVFIEGLEIVGTVPGEQDSEDFSAEDDFDESDNSDECDASEEDDEVSEEDDEVSEEDDEVSEEDDEADDSIDPTDASTSEESVVSESSTVPAKPRRRLRRLSEIAPLKRQRNRESAGERQLRIEHQKRIQSRMRRTGSDSDSDWNPKNNKSRRSKRSKRSRDDSSSEDDIVDWDLLSEMEGSEDPDSEDGTDENGFSHGRRGMITSEAKLMRDAEEFEPSSEGDGDSLDDEFHIEKRSRAKRRKKVVGMSYLNFTNNLRMSGARHTTTEEDYNGEDEKQSVSEHVADSLGPAQKPSDSGPPACALVVEDQKVNAPTHAPAQAPAQAPAPPPRRRAVRKSALVRQVVFRGVSGFDDSSRTSVSNKDIVSQYTLRLLKAQLVLDLKLKGDGDNRSALATMDLVAKRLQHKTVVPNTTLFERDVHEILQVVAESCLRANMERLKRLERGGFLICDKTAINALHCAALFWIHTERPSWVRPYPTDLPSAVKACARDHTFHAEYAREMIRQTSWTGVTHSVASTDRTRDRLKLVEMMNLALASRAYRIRDDSPPLRLSTPYLFKCFSSEAPLSHVSFDSGVRFDGSDVATPPPRLWMDTFTSQCDRSFMFHTLACETMNFFYLFATVCLARPGTRSRQLAYLAGQQRSWRMTYSQHKTKLRRLRLWKTRDYRSGMFHMEPEFVKMCPNPAALVVRLQESYVCKNTSECVLTRMFNEQMAMCHDNQWGMSAHRGLGSHVSALDRLKRDLKTKRDECLIVHPTSGSLNMKDTKFDNDRFQFFFNSSFRRIIQRTKAHGALFLLDDDIVHTLSFSDGSSEAMARGAQRNYEICSRYLMWRPPSAPPVGQDAVPQAPPLQIPKQLRARLCLEWPYPVGVQNPKIVVGASETVLTIAFDTYPVASAQLSPSDILKAAVLSDCCRAGNDPAAHLASTKLLMDLCSRTFAKCDLAHFAALVQSPTDAEHECLRFQGRGRSLDWVRTNWKCVATSPVLRGPGPKRVTRKWAASVVDSLLVDILTRCADTRAADEPIPASALPPFWHMYKTHLSVDRKSAFLRVLKLNLVSPFRPVQLWADTRGSGDDPRVYGMFTRARLSSIADLVTGALAADPGTARANAHMLHAALVTLVSQKMMFSMTQRPRVSNSQGLFMRFPDEWRMPSSEVRAALFHIYVGGMLAFDETRKAMYLGHNTQFRDVAVFSAMVVCRVRARIEALCADEPSPQTTCNTPGTISYDFELAHFRHFDRACFQLYTMFREMRMVVMFQNACAILAQKIQKLTDRMRHEEVRDVSHTFELRLRVGDATDEGCYLPLWTLLCFLAFRFGDMATAAHEVGPDCGYWTWIAYARDGRRVNRELLPFFLLLHRKLVEWSWCYPACVARANLDYSVQSMVSRTRDDEKKSRGDAVVKTKCRQCYVNAPRAWADGYSTFASRHAWLAYREHSEAHTLATDRVHVVVARPQVSQGLDILLGYVATRRAENRQTCILSCTPQNAMDAFKSAVCEHKLRAASIVVEHKSLVVRSVEEDVKMSDSRAFALHIGHSDEDDGNLRAEMSKWLATRDVIFIHVGSGMAAAFAAFGRAKASWGECALLSVLTERQYARLVILNTDRRRRIAWPAFHRFQGRTRWIVTDDARLSRLPKRCRDKSPMTRWIRVLGSGVSRQSCDSDKCQFPSPSPEGHQCWTWALMALE